MSPGISRRARAMMAAGMFLSQPAMQTMPSKLFPRVTSSMEGAFTSLVIWLPFMAWAPLVMPSWMVIVLNSMGVPPASRTPCLTASATWRRWKLQGPISVQVLAMPMMGLCRSSLLKPTLRKEERGAARDGPSVRTMEFFFGLISLLTCSPLALDLLQLRLGQRFSFTANNGVQLNTAICSSNQWQADGESNLYLLLSIR